MILLILLLCNITHIAIILLLYDITHVAPTHMSSDPYYIILHSYYYYIIITKSPYSADYRDLYLVVSRVVNPLQQNRFGWLLA